MDRILAKSWNIVKLYQNSIFLGFCILLISIISYNIGKINALEKTPLKVIKDTSNQANIYKATSKTEIQNTKYKIQDTDLRVVASKKSSTKRYHYLWCSGAKKIKEENKLWFNSAQEAETAGYTIAGNCEL